ncbi:MAG: helix-turn-helix domain-containing protein [Myxococcota bacterium]
MKPLSDQDYYETLDVPRSAEPEEIERAYKLAISTYSADSLAGYSVFEEGDVDVLRERIEIAYQTLSEPDSRSRYDLEISDRDDALPTDTAGSDPEVFATTAEKPAPPALEPLDALEDLDEQDGDWTGARLRRTRLRQGVELEDIADVTKVNPTYLRFLEEERYEGLPASVYVRGFVQGYAGCLGLDPKQVAGAYMERYEESKGGVKRGLFSRK